MTDAAQASGIEAPPTGRLVAPRHGGADAVPLPGGARSDDRGDGAADDRRRSRWARPDLVGRHGVPAVVDRQRAAVRQDQRPLRPQGDAPGHHRHLPAGVGAGGPRAVDAAADPRPWRAGRRRRRDHGDDVHDPRRHPLAPRARQVRRLLHRCVRQRQRDRATRRWVLRRPRLVAVGVPHQPAARRHRDGRRGALPAHPQDGQAPLDRSARRPLAHRQRDVGAAGIVVGWSGVRLGIAPDHRALRDRRRARRGVPAAGAAGARSRSCRCASSATASSRCASR